MCKIAVYPGSFDPFTNGHLDIVKKAAKLFDKTYVVIAPNSGKNRTYFEHKMAEAIDKTLRKNKIENCEVVVHNGLLGNFIKENNVNYVVRGLRNNMDYNYEENIAEVNKLLNPEIEYVYFRAENAGISSSMVKELIRYEQDVSKYVPKEILKMIKN